MLFLKQERLLGIEYVEWSGGRGVMDEIVVPCIITTHGRFVKQRDVWYHYPFKGNVLSPWRICRLEDWLKAFNIGRGEK
jgi:hypothetical protein